MRAEIAKYMDHDPHFAWRGQTVSRIENLSDIVFALAFGMLVSASSAPATYGELMPHLVSIIPVTAGFLFMVVLWNSHFIFFRRYAIADQKIMWLNGALLLLILFIAYPLRFTFESLFAFILMMFGSLQRMEQLGIETYQQAGHIITVFYVGYGLAYLIYQSMYGHALRKADDLQLSHNERQTTKQSIWRCRIQVAISAIVAPVAAFTIIGPLAGAFNLLTWPINSLIERKFSLESDE